MTYYVKSKRHRKFFKLDEEEEAIKWDKEHSSQKQKGRVSLTILTDAQAKDAEAAIAELPAGRTLLESVRKAWAFESKASISTLKKEYLASLEPFVGKEHLSHVDGRLKSFERSFDSFTDATPDALIKYLRERGCNKTVAHYRSTLDDFFKYCIRKDEVKANPFDKILDGDIMKNEAPKEVEFLNTEQTYRLLLYLICKHPKHLKFFILALFAGVRVGEVQRMKESYIDYGTHSIIFPAEIVKGRRHKKKSWHVQDYEPVLFEWLKSQTNLRCFQMQKRWPFAVSKILVYGEGINWSIKFHSTELGSASGFIRTFWQGYYSRPNPLGPNDIRSIHSRSNFNLAFQNDAGLLRYINTKRKPSWLRLSRYNPLSGSAKRASYGGEIFTQDDLSQAEKDNIFELSGNNRNYRYSLNDDGYSGMSDRDLVDAHRNAEAAKNNAAGRKIVDEWLRRRGYEKGAHGTCKAA